MQTPYPEQINPTTLFSRERRRQRMRLFLESFERRPKRRGPEIPLILQLPRDDIREPLFTPSDGNSR